MASPSHPEAMTPSRPGRTRTAPPMKPGNWPSSARYRSYLAFDFTGLFYLIAGLGVLRGIYAFAAGPEAWQALLTSYASPALLVIHVVILASVIFVGVRFFRLFPKAQPPRGGPGKPPPAAVMHAALYAAWIGITIALGAVLGGVIP